MKSLFGRTLDRSCPAASASSINAQLAANSAISPPFDSILDEGYATYDVQKGQSSAGCLCVPSDLTSQPANQSTFPFAGTAKMRSPTRSISHVHGLPSRLIESSPRQIRHAGHCMYLLRTTLPTPST
jgi:hypothetical protein